MSLRAGTPRRVTHRGVGLALACLAVSGCAHYSFTSLQPVNPAPDATSRSNAVWLKVKPLRMMVSTWDFVAPGQAPPPLVLQVVFHSAGPGAFFDPSRVAVDAPGRGLVRPRSYEGPWKFAYHGFGLDSCSGPRAADGASHPIQLIADNTCFLLTFDLAVAGEPLELHLEGIARNGQPVRLPTLRLSRREGRIISKPTP